MRPEGWKNPYRECVDCKYEPYSCGMEMCEGDKVEHKAFEAGADAYEEGLKKVGTHTNIVDDGLDIKGWRVFIKEE